MPSASRPPPPPPACDAHAGGNEHFRKGHYREAAEFYSCALERALAGGEDCETDVARILTNRSAVSLSAWLWQLVGAYAIADAPSSDLRLPFPLATIP